MWNRVVVQGVAALCMGLASTLAHAEVTTLKISHQWQQGDGRDEGARAFAKEVNERDPSLRFRIYPGASLISHPVKQIDALGDGAIDLAIFPLIYGVGRAPEFSGTIIPGAVSSVDDAKRLKGSEYEELLQEIAREHGFRILTWWWTEGGIASSKGPITTPDSAAGMKFRGADRTLDAVLVEAGASVFSMPSTELYSALQTGVLDGLMTSYESFMSMRLYEQVKYATLGGDYTTFVVFQPLVVSTKVWDALTPEQRTIFEEAADATVDTFNEAQYALRDEIVEKFRGAGVEVRSMTAEEYDEWLALAKKVSWPAFAEISPRAAKLLEATGRN